MGGDIQYRSGKCLVCRSFVELGPDMHPVAHSGPYDVEAVCLGAAEPAISGTVWAHTTREYMDRAIAELNTVPSPGPAQSNPFAVPAPVPVPTADCAWCGRDDIAVNALGFLATHYPPAATGWCLGSGKRPGGVKGGAVPQMPANPFAVSSESLVECPMCTAQVWLTIGDKIVQHSVHPGNPFGDVCAASGMTRAEALEAMLNAPGPVKQMDDREEFLTELKKAPGSSHYHGLDPQPIEVLRAWNLPYCRSVAIKYLARAGQKGTPADAKLDLQKAIQYIEWAIEDLPEETE